MPSTPPIAGDPPSSAAGDSRRSVWVLLRHTMVAAAIVHVAFVVLFARLGFPLLVWSNVGSILLYVGCHWLLGRRRNLPAGMLIVGEVVLHAGAAVLMLGWDSGFHYYLVTIVAPLIVATSGSLGSKLARVALYGLYYAGLDAWTHRTPPLYALDQPTLDALRYFNLAGMFAILSFVALTYYRLVTQAEQALRELATTDPLTGLHNRRRMLEMVRERRAQDERRRRGLCVLLCDIDHFKAVNDQRGHDIGDRALQMVGQVLAASLREHDAVARWGGEEFLVLVRDADLEIAAQAAERIRRAVAETPMAIADQPELAITITIGVARLGDGEPVDAAIARADAALYRGKAAGRNRVAVESCASASAGSRAGSGVEAAAVAA